MNNINFNVRALILFCPILVFISFITKSQFCFIQFSHMTRYVYWVFTVILILFSVFRVVKYIFHVFCLNQKNHSFEFLKIVPFHYPVFRVLMFLSFILIFIIECLLWSTTCFIQFFHNRQNVSQVFINLFCLITAQDYPT